LFFCGLFGCPFIIKSYHWTSAFVLLAQEKPSG
jgi:hypothetical protein